MFLAGIYDLENKNFIYCLGARRKGEQHFIVEISVKAGGQESIYVVLESRISSSNTKLLHAVYVTNLKLKRM